MNTPLNRDEQLEHLANKALRDQPLLRAPISLESKVLAEIVRRATAPWWQNSFAQWPMAARVVFLVMSVGFVKLGLEAVSLVIDPLDPAARSAALFAEVSWIHALFATVGAVFRGLPTLWVYGGVAVLAALYVMLFGMSAAAYRTLYASR